MISVRTILGILGMVVGIYLLYKLMFGKSKLERIMIGRTIRY